MAILKSPDEIFTMVFFSIPVVALLIYLSIRLTRYVFKVNENTKLLSDILDELKKLNKET